MHHSTTNAPKTIFQPNLDDPSQLLKAALFANSPRAAQVEHWCVCQWAFASYLQRAGGCDKIQNIVCEATNMVALTAYRQMSSSASLSLRTRWNRR